jgi:hypothetical protein
MNMKLNRLLGAVLATGVIGLVAPSGAQANLLQNGSFEAGSWTNTGSGWMDVALSSTAITNWSLVSNNVAWSSPGNTDGIVAFDGSHSLDLTGMGNINPNGGVTQTISTMIGQSYTLNFFLDAVVAYGVPASVLVQAGSASQTFNKMTNGWEGYSLDFVAVDLNTAITLSGVRSPNTYYIGLDNVSVVTATPSSVAVPEPDSLALLGLGMVGLIGVRRQRR